MNNLKCAALGQKIRLKNSQMPELVRGKILALIFFAG